MHYWVKLEALVRAFLLVWLQALRGPSFTAARSLMGEFPQLK